MTRPALNPTRLFAFACLTAFGGAQAAPEPPAPETERALREAESVERQIVKLVESVRPCSVTVFNLVKRGEGFLPAGSGSGVVLKAGGLILTNEHVVKGADRIEVAFLDGRRFVATVENRVAEYDIALLQARDDKGKPLRGLKAALPGRSEGLKDGEWVIATGNPFFLASSGHPVVTLGAISGLHRVMGGEFFYGDAIQHDAEINPGNSGGPLWNLDGRFVGINGKIISRSAGPGPSSSGVGFAIPVDQVQNFMKQLLDEDASKVEPGDLGVAVETFKDGKGREAGARITAVRASSAAATHLKGGGLQVGDVIECITIKFRNFNIRNATEYTNTMAVWPEGTRIENVQVRRAGSLLILSDFVLGPSGP